MDFASILSSSFSSIEKGYDVETAARHTFPALAKGKASIASLLAADRKSAQTGAALKASNLAIAAGLRSILKSEGVDVSDGKAVRDALRPNVWTDEGAVMPEAGTAKPDDGTAERLVYDRVAQRLSRLAKAIIGADKVAPQKVAVRVPRALQSTIDALIAEHGAAVIREALKRAAK